MSASVLAIAAVSWTYGFGHAFPSCAFRFGNISSVFVSGWGEGKAAGSFASWSPIQACAGFEGSLVKPSVMRTWKLLWQLSVIGSLAVAGSGFTPTNPEAPPVLNRLPIRSIADIVNVA